MKTADVPESHISQRTLFKAMSYIAEFEVETEVLQEALQAVPTMVLRYEDLRIAQGGDEMFMFWASGDSFIDFESALSNDPTVAEFAILAEAGEERLYRVTYSAEGVSASTYPVATKRDIAILDNRKTYKGAQVRARVPSRTALQAYRETCVERDIPFRLKKIYHEEGGQKQAVSDLFGVTKAQEEALLTALKLGYFEIPREATLEAVAKEIGISTQAVSTRIRRGQTNLLNNALNAGSA